MRTRAVEARSWVRPLQRWWMVGGLLATAGCTQPEATPTSPDLPGHAPSAPAAATAVAKEQLPVGDLNHSSESCRSCRSYHCVDVEGTGFNLLTGCFANADPAFTESCIAAKNCMTRNHCGLGPLNSIDCFCGTTPTEACVTGAEPPNGPCVETFTKAARQQDFNTLMQRYDAIQFPLGVAHALRLCDVTHCPACIEKAPEAAAP
jgi:hypothetical protein